MKLFKVLFSFIYLEQHYYLNKEFGLFYPICLAVMQLKDFQTSVSLYIRVWSNPKFAEWLHLVKYKDPYKILI